MVFLYSVVWHSVVVKLYSVVRCSLLTFLYSVVWCSAVVFCILSIVFCIAISVLHTEFITKKQTNNVTGDNYGIICIKLAD